MVAPTSPGAFENRVTCDGCVSKDGEERVSRSIRRPVINEIVVEPQRDWDNSGAGGDGVSFNDPPGTSVAPSPDVTADDQWVEILTNTGSPEELRGWTLEFTDRNGQSQSRDLEASIMRIIGSYVVVGAPGGIGRDSVVALRDEQGNFVDRVDLRAFQARDGVGYATGVDNESIARSPSGSVGTSLSLFKRRSASIGRPNP
jgi:hypothetical protein